MNAKKLAIVAVALAGAFVGAAAEAHGRDDVQFSVTIGTPFVAPVRPVFAPLPVARFDGRRDDRSQYRAPTRWDVDGDGIPNRYDRFDNRRSGRDARGYSRW